MKRACRKRVYYWFLDYGEIAFVLSILIVAVFIIGLILTILLAPKTVVAGDIVNFRSARRLAAVIVRSEKVTTRASEPIKILYMEVSCYSPTVAECDGNPLMTASGQRVRVGGIAADLRVLPFGSLVIVQGYNNGEVCEIIDTGSAIKGLKLDVFLWSTHEAIHFGRRRNVRVQVLYIPKTAA